MNINIILVTLPAGINALTTLNDDGTYTIIIDKDLPHSKQITSILHEDSHIQGDDFNCEEHATLLEQMRHHQLDDTNLEGINFFYHYI